MHKKCNTIHVCAFLGMQNHIIKVNPGVEGGCIPLYLVEEPLWDSYKKILTFYLNIFVQKCKIEFKETKKPDPFFPIFWVGQKRANKHLFF